MSSGYQTKFSWPISRKGDTTCRDNQRTDYDQWKVNDSTAQWYAATCLVEIYINSMEYLFCFWFSVPCLWQNKKMCVSISLPSSKFTIFLILFVHMMLKTLLIPAVCRRHVIYNYSNKPGHCRVSTAQW